MMRSATVHMAVTLRTSFAALFLCICSNFRAGEGIWLSLEQNGIKCVSEELHSNVVVLGDYIVIPDDHPEIPTISVKVTSPYGDNLHRNDNVTHGQFAFTTQEAGSYLACFMVQDGQGVNGAINVNIDWKNGITAKDWDSVAKKEKLEGVKFEIRRLEGQVDTIHENLLHLKSREADMRKVSEATNAKVAWLSFVSLGVCIVVSILQVLYLKQFFRRKKLL